MSTQQPAVQIPAQLVKELRERTNAGFSDCRAALVEAGGDLEKAISILRKKGQAAAAKKAMREASEGLVGSYIHAGGKIGAHRSVSAALPRHRHACCRARSALCAARRSDCGDAGEGARDLPRTGARNGETGECRRQNCQRQDGEILRRELPL